MEDFDSAARQRDIDVSYMIDALDELANNISASGGVIDFAFVWDLNALQEQLEKNISLHRYDVVEALGPLIDRCWDLSEVKKGPHYGSFTWREPVCVRFANDILPVFTVSKASDEATVDGALKLLGKLLAHPSQQIRGNIYGHVFPNILAKKPEKYPMIAQMYGEAMSEIAGMDELLDMLIRLKRVAETAGQNWQLALKNS
jgi:hypothetical protein